MELETLFSDENFWMWHSDQIAIWKKYDERKRGRDKKKSKKEKRKIREMGLLERIAEVALTLTIFDRTEMKKKKKTIVVKIAQLMHSINPCSHWQNFF